MENSISASSLRERLERMKLRNREVIENIVRASTFKTEDVIACRVTEQTHIVRSSPIVTLGGSVWGRRSDFCLMMGKRKAGKTTVLQMAIASSLRNYYRNNSISLDTLGIVSALAEGKDVIYLDNEGSQEDTNDFRLAVNHILGIEETPPNFHTYNFRQYSQEQVKAITEVLFNSVHTKPHMVILDGLADLIISPNNEKDSNELVRWVMRYASSLETCIICVIHENYGIDGKARGHLSSEAERKSGGAISVSKDPTTKTHLITCKFLRKSDDFEPIAFRFDKDAKRPISIELTAEEKTIIKQVDYEKIKALTKIRNNCFLGVSERTEKALKESLKLYQGNYSDPNKQAKRNIDYLLKYDLITEETKDSIKYYQPTQIKDNTPKVEAQILEETETDEDTTF